MPDTTSQKNNNQKKDQQDMYRDSKKSSSADTPLIPAATLVLLRDDAQGLQVLMLRKNPKIGFGGKWVFPGGRIDESDYSDKTDLEQAARIAAARETHEEAGIKTDPNNFVLFSQWTPPPISEKRFTTSFFATRVPDLHQVTIDGGEIHDHQWIRPTDAIKLRDAREIELVPPTWVTLHTLSQHDTVESLLTHLDSIPTRTYETHVGQGPNGERIVMWHGDAGYEAWDASIKGPRHRLIMTRDKFVFEDTVYS